MLQSVENKSGGTVPEGACRSLERACSFKRSLEDCLGKNPFPFPFPQQPWSVNHAIHGRHNGGLRCNTRSGGKLANSAARARLTRRPLSMEVFQQKQIV